MLALKCLNLGGHLPVSLVTVAKLPKVVASPSVHFTIVLQSHGKRIVLETANLDI
jgi:hypothetical protein